MAVLGDSIAFGYWVAEEDAFARQLELLLGESRGEGPPVEVLNFGVPGYNLGQEIETLRSRVLAFEPDVVVLAFCLNDLEGVFSYELGLVQDRATRRQSVLGRCARASLSHSHSSPGWSTALPSSRRAGASPAPATPWPGLSTSRRSRSSERACGPSIPVLGPS